MNDNEKFILLLRKGVYPYEYIDNWKTFYEIMLPSKLKFHSNLNMKGISVKNYKHATNIWDIFDMSNFGHYHNLYVEFDTLLLSDVFEDLEEHVLKNMN